MKMNWGTGIALWLIVFVTGILSFVFFAFQQDVNLVNKEYYQKGVHYDDVRKAREKGTSQSDKMSINQEGEMVSLTFDSTYFESIKNAEVQFYRPSDRREDLHIPFEQNRLEVSKSKLFKGRYQLNISWEKDGEKYMLQKYFFLK